MMRRRVIFGRQTDGVVSLRVSLPGHDPQTADPDDPNALSFNSDWPLLRIHALGRFSGSSAVFPTLPYIPYFETRLVVGDVYYDDGSYIGQVLGTNQQFSVLRCACSFNSVSVTAKYVSGDVAYVIYREPSGVT